MGRRRHRKDHRRYHERRRDEDPKRLSQRDDTFHTRRILLANILRPEDSWDDVERHDVRGSDSLKHLAEQSLYRDRGRQGPKVKALTRGLLGPAELLRYQNASYDMLRDEIVCRDRKKRREVLFAERRAGRGKSVSPFRRYSENSRVDCKRR